MMRWLPVRNSKQFWSLSSKRQNHQYRVICRLQLPCLSSQPILCSRLNQQRLLSREKSIVSGRFRSLPMTSRRIFQNCLQLKKRKTKRKRRRHVPLQEKEPHQKHQGNYHRFRKRWSQHQNHRSSQIHLPSRHLPKRTTMWLSSTRSSSKRLRSQKTRLRRRRTREDSTKT